MICPSCSSPNTRVVDSRDSEGGAAVRRRRECEECGKRFTTYERAELAARLTVIKKDGSRVPFSADNIYKGVAAACGKRPVPEDAKRDLARQVEEELAREFEREVPSSVIGQRVMARLRNLDEIAYIRYASEHLGHQSAGELEAEIRDLKSRPRESKDQRPLFDG